MDISIIQGLILELKVFFFSMSVLTVIFYLLHAVSVFSLKRGKIVNSSSELALFGAAVSYIVTMLICGF
jgi:hypothetical protein